MTNKVELCIYKHGRNFCVTLGERRIAGPKPVFYGQPLYSWRIDEADLQEAIASAREEVEK